MANHMRLDAAESVFFSRQLESIDRTLYDVKFPLLKARQLLPKVANVGEWDRAYTYRMYETVGNSEVRGPHWIGDKATDLDSADAKGTEFTTPIKDLGAKYEYSIGEIKTAMAHGVPLDELKARAARQMLEEDIDTVLAFGDASLGMKGFANHASVDASTFTPSDKGGGNTEWNTAGADPLLIVSDMNQILNQVWTALKEAQGITDKLTMVLPSSRYALVASTPLGDNADKTILKFMLDNSPYLAAVVPWHKLEEAGTGDSARMIVYARDPMVCGALVPLEYTRQPEQERGLMLEVPVMARCGGAVIRYPVAMAYGDEI